VKTPLCLRKYFRRHRDNAKQRGQGFIQSVFNPRGKDLRIRGRRKIVDNVAVNQSIQIRPVMITRQGVVIIPSMAAGLDKRFASSFP